MIFYALLSAGAFKLFSDLVQWGPFEWYSEILADFFVLPVVCLSYGTCWNHMRYPLCVYNLVMSDQCSHMNYTPILICFSVSLFLSIFSRLFAGLVTFLDISISLLVSFISHSKDSVRWNWDGNHLDRWCECLVVACYCEKLPHWRVFSAFVGWLAVGTGTVAVWTLYYPRLMYHFSLRCKIRVGVDLAVFWTENFWRIQKFCPQKLV